MIRWLTSKPSEPINLIPLDELRSTLYNQHLSASRGFQHLFNDELDLAASILAQDAAHSPIHALGHATSAFIAALLGFEEEWIAEGIKRLENAEKLALQKAKEIRKGIADAKKMADQPQDLKEREVIAIEYEVISADCDLMHSILFFLKESVMEYAKGIYRLRRAYNTFDASWKALNQDKSHANAKFSNLVQDLEQKQEILPEESVVSVGGVSFGKGLFSLLLSLLPSKAKSALGALGYHYSRSLGLSQLRNCVYCGLRSTTAMDFHTPIAALALLTYHTVVASLTSFRMNPLVQKNGVYSVEVCTEISECQTILNEMRKKYPNGRLWKLMEGKLCRARRKIHEAIRIFDGEKEAKNENVLFDVDDDGDVFADDPKQSSTRHLMQLEYLTQYEHAWYFSSVNCRCLVLAGDYLRGADHFNSLAINTQWSRAFYTYFQALCLFAANRHQAARELLVTVQPLLKKRFGGRLVPAEVFVQRKAAELIVTPPPENQSWELGVLEIVCIWNAFGQMDSGRLLELEKRVKDCYSDCPVETSAWNLIRGCIQRELGKYELAMESLGRTAAMVLECRSDGHIPTLAMQEGVIMFILQSKWQDAQDWLGKVDNVASTLGRVDFETRLAVRTDFLKETVQSNQN